MEYNTTRNNLVISEYGRNIQKIIEYTISLEDKSKRTQLANLIVNVMAQMHPHVKETVDFKHKLWDHLHIIADFKLDVDSPFPPPSVESLQAKPDRIEYSNKNIRYRQYGKNTERIIEKALEYEDGPEKEAMVETIANHLKKSYLNWNRDSVNDELIIEHLEELSKGNLKLNDNVRLTHTGEILARNKKKKFVSKKPSGGSYGKYRGRHNSK